jgi:hypothetical protein
VDCHSLILGLFVYGWHAPEALRRAWLKRNSHALRKASERATLNLSCDNPLPSQVKFRRFHIPCEQTLYAVGHNSPEELDAENGAKSHSLLKVLLLTNTAEVCRVLETGGFPPLSACKVPVFFTASLLSFNAADCSGYYISYPGAVDSGKSDPLYYQGPKIKEPGLEPTLYPFC